MSSDSLIIKLKHLSRPKAVKVIGAPEKIYLCLGDYDAFYRETYFSDLNEVSWSDEDETDLSIQYVRVDIHEETTKQLRALEDAIEMSLTNHDPLNSANRFESENICIQSTWGEEGFQEIHQAIQNSRTRKQG